MNILTLIILGFLILGGIVGYYKVFARPVLNVIIAVFALSVSYYASPFLATELGGSITIDEAVVQKLSTVILEDMQTKVTVDYARHNGLLYNEVPQEIVGDLVNQTFHVDPNTTATINILQYMGFPQSVTSKMQGVIQKYDNIYIDSSNAPEYIAIFFVRRAMEIGTFIVIAWLIYHGMQFGIESNDPDGLQILDHFAADICGCEHWWKTETIVERIVEDIRTTVGGSQALMALSGGVDSSVCAALMHRAIGEQMHCLYIDTGLMRKGDTRVVRELFGEAMGIEVRCVNARDRFFGRLRGLTSPSDKWAAVSDEFSIIYREEAALFSGVDFLVKGTIYSDVLNFSRDEQNLGGLTGLRAYDNFNGFEFLE